LAFFTALFAPISEFGVKAFGRRLVFIALIGAVLSSPVASLEENTYGFWNFFLITTFFSYLGGLVLGVPCVVVGIAKRGLQAYYNRSLTLLVQKSLEVMKRVACG
jgi:hypothetical protein